MTRRTRSRPGMTLIETIVALGLLIFLIGLWLPLLRQVMTWSWPDAELQAVLTFEVNLQEKADAATSFAAPGNDLQLTTKDVPFTKDGQHGIKDVVQTVTHYQKEPHTAANPPMLRMTTIDGSGHMPLLLGAKTVSWRQQPNGVSYTITMISGRRYEGMILDEKKSG